MTTRTNAARQIAGGRSARRLGRTCRAGFESLEVRRVLAPLQLIEQPPITASDTAGARHVTLADLDGDADPDMLVASLVDGRLGWFANRGNGEFESYQLINDQLPNATVVIAADLDGDDLLDVVGVSSLENRIVWHRNKGGGAGFEAAQTVTEFAFGGESVVAADVDGDNDLDLISGSSDSYDSDVAWYENLDGLGTFGPQQIISIEVQGTYAIATGDLDLDGDTDVISASYYDNKVAWYENTDGLGTFGPQHALEELQGANEVITADVDGDGDLDLVAGSFYYSPSEIVWYENLQGTPMFGPARPIAADLDAVESIQAIDMDMDGDLDLVTQSIYEGRVLWYENTDGLGTYGPRKQVASGLGAVFSAAAGDLDGDSDVDVAFASLSLDIVGWSRNEAGSFAPYESVSMLGAVGAEAIATLDVDGDGDLDVAVASTLGGTLTWNENLDGQGTFGPDNVVDEDYPSIVSVEAGDLNGDGLPDLLTTSLLGAIAWHPNQSEGNRFASARIISLEYYLTEEALPLDVDADGDLDVVATATNRDNPAFVWFENRDGLGDFGPARVIQTSMNEPRKMAPSDFDGDGDLDLAVVSLDDRQVAWFETTPESGPFGTEHLISATTDLPVSIRAGDIDRDGDDDVVVVSFNDNSVQWFENTDGQGSFSARRLIGQTPVAPDSLELADLDEDGDLDVFVAAIGTAANDFGAVVWYENLDSGQAFADQQPIIERFRGASEVRVADIDGDLDLDLLAAAYDMSRVIWFRNDSVLHGDFDNDGVLTAADIDHLCAARHDAEPNLTFDLTDDGNVDQADFERLVFDLLGTTIGDANLDGVFNSSDFVSIFAAGEYEDGIPSNSGWAEGDWNCDGDFTASDFVAAFQQGGYVTASVPGMFAVSATRNDDANHQGWRPTEVKDPNAEKLPSGTANDWAAVMELRWLSRYGDHRDKRGARRR